MGNNWAHSYDIRVAQSGADLLVRDGTGRRDTYFLQADGSFSKRGFFRRGTLAANVFTLEFADRGRWIFNPLNGSPSAGKIAQSVDRNGNALQFSYDGLGRLAVIVDTLGRTYQVQYDVNGRVGALIDFSGRSVVYSYYGTGNPLGANGMLRTIRSPLVTGTPTGNDFPAGKTQTFTYSVGSPNAALNDNLLTVTDPKGQTCARFTYSPSLVVTDVNFDRVLSVQLGNNADPIDKPSHLTWLTQLPLPANGYAVLKCIANDPVGNVRETLFDSRNLPVAQLDYTGRSIPGVAVTETANRPTRQLRASDPQFFETRAQWNLNFLPTRITLPRSNALAYVWETDFNPTATAREAGNLRTLRQIGLASETLVWRSSTSRVLGRSSNPSRRGCWRRKASSIFSARAWATKWWSTLSRVTRISRSSLGRSPTPREGILVCIIWAPVRRIQRPERGIGPGSCTGLAAEGTGGRPRPSFVSHGRRQRGCGHERFISPLWRHRGRPGHARPNHIQGFERLAKPERQPPLFSGTDDQSFTAAE
jgi:YD repeat-containing protein